MPCNNTYASAIWHHLGQCHFKTLSTFCKVADIKKIIQLFERNHVKIDKMEHGNFPAG